MIAAVPGLPPLTLTIPVTNPNASTPIPTPPSQSSLPAPLPPTSTPTPAPSTSSTVLPVLLGLSLVLIILGGSLLCWNYLHDTSNGRHRRDVRDESMRRGGEGEGEEERQWRRVMEKEASLVTSEDDLEEQEEQEVSEKGEGAKMEVRSGMRWWARMWRKMRVGNSAEMRDLEPGAR